MIYFIKNITTGNIKIGFSENPRKRLRELQTGSAEKIVLVKTIEGDQKLEGHLHELFSHCRLDGEWFSPAEEILEFIKGKDRKTLEGKFFHSFKDGKVVWQGYVISEAKDGYFLVQLFEWVMGEPSSQKLVRVDTMLDWDFYDTAEEMNDAWQRKWENK